MSKCQPDLLYTIAESLFGKLLKDVIVIAKQSLV